MTVWQIRTKEYRHTHSDPIIYEGSKEKVIGMWEEEGFKSAYEESLDYPFGLYEVTFQLIDGSEVKRKYD